MRKPLNIISVSGGKDSTALYLLAQEFYGDDFLPVFADTGHEHPVTVNYVKNLHVLANGRPVEIVKADFSKHLARKEKTPTGNPFLDMSLWKGRFPSAKAQFCTEHLKLWPILFYLDKHFPKDQYEWIMHTGIRAAESKKRSKRQPFEWNSFFDCMSVLPLLYEKKEAIFSLMEKRLVPPNPLYALGFNRVGCFPCIYGLKAELRGLPDWAWDRLKLYEETMGASWFHPSILPKTQRKVNELPSIDQVRKWSKTSRGGSQFDLFASGEVEDAPSCMTGFVICE